MVPLESQGVQAWDRYAYVNNNPVRYNDPSGHTCSDPEDPTQTCDGGSNKKRTSPLQTVKPKTPTQTLIGPPNPKRYFLGSFYIPSAEPPEVEDDGDANISNKAEWLANGLDFLAEHLPRGISSDKPDNVAIFAYYEVSNLGIDNITIFVENASDALVSTTSITLFPDPPNMSAPNYAIRPTGAMEVALLQTRPNTSSEFLLCSNCLSATPNVNVELLPTIWSLTIQVNMAWMRNGVHAIPILGNIRR